ncbi:MAG: LysM peptidoglycan-binding domain-containing protein [Anaerolineae bacterium]
MRAVEESNKTSKDGRPDRPPSWPVAPTLCPHLGTLDDRQTALAFPTMGNHCYHSGRAVSVATAHQQEFCLTSNHTSCPVFRHNSASPPAETSPASDLVVARRRLGQWGRRLIPIFLILLVLLLIAFFGFNEKEADGLAINEEPLVEPGTNVLYPPTPPGAEGAAQPDATETPASPAAVSGETETPPPVENTAAAAPPQEEPPSPAAAAGGGGSDVLPTPAIVLCTPPSWWVPYFVRVGDTLFSLAGARGTSVSAVRAANCMNDNRIVAGQRIFLPPSLIPQTPAPLATATPPPTITHTPQPTATATNPNTTSPTATTIVSDTPIATVSKIPAPTDTPPPPTATATLPPTATNTPPATATGTPTAISTIPPPPGTLPPLPTPTP